MFRNVVWATDGSAHADRALEYARAIARADGATVHVVHVVELLVAPRLAGQNSHIDEPDIDAKIERQRRELAESGIKSELRTVAERAGEAALCIAEVARDVDADLIVIGTRGHSPVVNTVIGSVTQRLLRVSPCPVLAVPPVREPRRSHHTAAAATAG